MTRTAPGTRAAKPWSVRTCSCCRAPRHTQGRPPAPGRRRRRRARRDEARGVRGAIRVAPLVAPVQRLPRRGRAPKAQASRPRPSTRSCRICSQESSRRVARRTHGRAPARDRGAREALSSPAKTCSTSPRTKSTSRRASSSASSWSTSSALGHKAVGPCLRDPFGKIPVVAAAGVARRGARRPGVPRCPRVRALRPIKSRRGAVRGVGPRRVARRWIRPAARRRARVRGPAGAGGSTKLRVPFVTEHALRAEGHAKTPDVKLDAAHRGQRARS